MLHLPKDHDPRKNALLLEQLQNGKKTDLKKAVSETERLFHQLMEKQPVPSPSASILKRLFRPFSIVSPLGEQTKAFIDENGTVLPDWKGKLDEELYVLQSTIQREVNVADFGAVGDGLTDSTAAFKLAIGKGRVRVIIPAGVFITKGIHLPSYTQLIGAGKGKTIVRLHDQAPKETILITNANHHKGNNHLYVEGLSLDWNVERLGNTEKTSSGGNHSSCLTFAHVHFGWVKDVEAINPGNHCFDISSTKYNYSGDGFRARGSSKYIWLENLNGYGFGDDGVTTHHSDYIYIGHSHMCDPSGRAHRTGFSNSNGFEIDDGSRNIFLVNNTSARCFGGVEIKAHENSSAAANVQIIGHISVNDNRSYNFRHIGHHKHTDAASKTAYNIMATNIMAIAPVFTDLYKDSSPRGMVISAYKNVVINGFILTGSSDYDYKKYPVIAIQYRAENVMLNHISLQDFTSAGAPIKVFGGQNRAKGIVIKDIHLRNCGSSRVEADPAMNIVDKVILE